MLRELGSFESAAAFTGEFCPFNVVAVARLERALDEEAVRAALAALQRRHGLLGASIVRRDRRYRFERSEDAVPVEVEAEAEQGAWQEVAEEELMTGFELGSGPLLRVRLLSSPERSDGELVLTLHHAIVDASAATLLVSEMLRLAAGGIDTESESGAAGPALPQPADEHMPRAYRGVRKLPRLASFVGRELLADGVHRWRTRRLPKEPLNQEARNRIVCFDLDAEETRALVRGCRRRRLTLNATLYAATLLALARHRRVRGTLPLRFFVFPELRRYLEPPIEDDAVAPYLTVQRLAVDVAIEAAIDAAIDAAAGSELWALASDVERELARSFRRGEKFLSNLMTPTVMRMSLRHRAPRMADAALSYTGPVDSARPGMESVLELHSFVSNPYLGPELAAQARLFRGRLCWDLVYLDTDFERGEAQETAGEISRILSGNES